MWTKNENFQHPELEEYLNKLNENSARNFKFYTPYELRETMFKLCNSRLNIRYTISATETTIKLFIYKIETFKFYIACKDWKDLSRALAIHKSIECCKTKKELKELLEKNMDFIF